MIETEEAVARADGGAVRSMGLAKPWVAGDWNGFFGLFTNVLLNVIVRWQPVVLG
jgi:hypothetical protein